MLFERKVWGELLTTVGRDGNDQMLQLCFALVEVENKETWTWFMELLIEDLGGPEVCKSINFMSDQQKVNISNDLINILKRLCNIPTGYYRFK